MAPNVCFAVFFVVSAIVDQGLGQSMDDIIINVFGREGTNKGTHGSSSSDVTTSFTRILELLDQLQNDMAAVEACNQTVAEPHTYPRDCQEYLDRGFNTSGVYTVTLTPNDTTTNTEAYCDMETDGGGWTVFQRRVSDVISFERDWDAYKHGFGPLEGDLWWGNEHVALSVNDGRTYDLRIDLFDWSGEHRYAKYANFRVASEEDQYRLVIGQYTGNAGESLAYHNNMLFSTFDNDNDEHSDENCAMNYHSGFWFKRCANVSLNYPYQPSSAAISPHLGVMWRGWHGTTYSLHRMEMKFRVTS